jgi:hypothetical protein
MLVKVLYVTSNQIQNADDERFRNYVKRRLQETDFDPWAGGKHSLLVPVEVLVDLLMNSLPADVADTAVAQVTLDVKRGDPSARYEKLLIDSWSDAKISGRSTPVEDEVPESEHEQLALAGRDLVSTLMLVGFTSNSRRLSIVNDVVTSESANQNFLAAGCQALMQVAFQELQGAAKGVAPTVGAAQDAAQARKTYTPPSKTGGGCYVATAVYGSYDCPEVWVLRRFRDQSLARTALGKVLIRLYYLTSPRALRLVGPTLSCLSRRPIDSLVKVLKWRGFSDSPYTDEAEN